ncbi:ABC transporter ATP-binding protein [Halobacteriales archaeon QH_7_65_31]|nr:MAG: ABC transporter ATP-binding protein [Halobacteriales archaeon QH_7_65_31]
MIRVEGLVHRYDETAAIDGVDLTFPDGEYVVLAGPNGSGKTTLVRHLNALLDPDEGRVLVNGTETTDDPVAARTAVGMTFQDPRDGFVAATVEADVAFGPENLGLAHAEIDRRVRSALDAVNMRGRGDDRLESLSGGEQMRVAVAGALAMEPDHLILDEPFAGLDWPARRDVLDRLRALAREGTAILVVTHDLRDHVDCADRVVVLADGSVAVDAPPEQARDRLSAFDVRPP